MKIYLSKRDGPSDFYDAIQKEKAEKTQISGDDWVGIYVSEKGVFFHPTEYKIAGFLLSLKDLKQLKNLVELKQDKAPITNS